MTCGYPLPCPHHTVVIDLEHDPPIVTTPVRSNANSLWSQVRLAQIANALAGEVRPQRKR